MRELGRWYNIRVEFENPQAMNYRLHFLAERDQKIEEVLQLLNMLGKVQATYENNKISVNKKFLSFLVPDLHLKTKSE